MHLHLNLFSKEKLLKKEEKTLSLFYAGSDKRNIYSEREKKSLIKH